ncbi:hypothetical protein [Bradyrhizobium sp. CCGE-LA001]|uniref:hypothetical protein n=1 Tax=Bradyrhizobium sp. CCGE-LA001 TaxID=1223566 RepID=UPI0002AAB05B|nr:hypothetical protein [Bradyrhizobium sp. CCGE-LA001]AMA55957.1 hypothetical protein BCCGELA001_06555 [Bradyrhizobium sp. CCGE-LA001]
MNPDEIEAQLQRVNDFPRDFNTAVRALEVQRQGKDRSFIVYAVVGLYVASIALTVMYLVFFVGMYEGEPIFNDLSEVVKVAILPILTLVIGYYFGSK